MFNRKIFSETRNSPKLFFFFFQIFNERQLWIKKKKKSKKREENNFKFLKERLRFDGGPANLSVGSLSSGAENMI